MLPPGRVLYLRRFKASPRPPLASLKQGLALSFSDGVAGEGQGEGSCRGQQYGQHCNLHSATGAYSAEQEQKEQDLRQHSCHGSEHLQNQAEGQPEPIKEEGQTFAGMQDPRSSVNVTIALS